MSNIHAIDKVQISKLTTFERISLSFNNDKIKLSKKENVLLKIWTSAYHMIIDLQQSEEIASKLGELYGRSRAQAFRDMKNAKDLYAIIDRGNKEGERNVLKQIGFKQMKQALDDKDYDRFVKIYKEVIKLGGYEREDQDIPDFQAFKQHVYNITINPSDVGLPQHSPEDIEKLFAHFSKKKKSSQILEITEAKIVDE